MRCTPNTETPRGTEPAPRALPLLGPLALLALLATSLLSTPAHAQWKWRDQSGQVNVSDRPPPRSVPDKDILARPVVAEQRRAPPPAASAASGAAFAASAPATPLERELQARKRAAEQEQAAKAKADEERNATQRAENCRNARSQINTLDSGQRIARMNDKGEREVLDDSARAEELRRAREAVAANCK